MKWKQFLVTWLIVFLLAPSIWTHTLLMAGARPPGSPQVSPPLFIPFGAIYFGGELWGQLIVGDFSDALMIFILMIFPILIYTFILSSVIYYSFQKIRHQ